MYYETWEGKIAPVETKKEVEEIISQINNCSYCNNGKIYIKLREYYLPENSQCARIKINIYSDNSETIVDVMWKVVFCNHCKGGAEIQVQKVKRETVDMTKSMDEIFDQLKDM